MDTCLFVFREIPLHGVEGLIADDVLDLAGVEGGGVLRHAEMLQKVRQKGVPLAVSYG